MADWQKKAEEDRKVVLAMLGTPPLSLSAEDSGRGGLFGGGPPGAGPGVGPAAGAGAGARRGGAAGPGLATAPAAGGPGATGAAGGRRGGGLGFGGGAPAAPIANVPATYIGVGGQAPAPGQLTPNLPLWVISNGGGSYGWLEPAKSEAASRHVMFGGIGGDLYYPKDTPAGKKLPTVIWLHGYS